jgi:hypothetical protein
MSDLTQLAQVQSHFEEGQQFLWNRKQRQVSQLILLNNLQKGDENIASTLLVTLFLRTLAAHYEDKQQIKFVPGQEMSNRSVMEMNILAQNDYREMEKDKLDYDWMWDTLFFGRGFMETYRFDTERKIMMPEVINPLALNYDPYFADSKEWRYYNKWLSKSKWEIERLIAKGDITGIKSSSEIPSGMDPYLWNFKVRRDQARKAVAVATDSYQADVYQILESFEYADQDYLFNGDSNRNINAGDKICIWTDKDFSKVLYREKLDLRDGPDGTSKWPIVIKEAFREPHSSVPFSVADLLDDKHRAKSVLLNLALIAAKDKANPLYGYNPDKVKDISQLLSRQINQHIPMDSEDAMWPLNTQNPMDQGLQAFIQVLGQEASDPIGTGMELSPSKKGAQTATHDAIQQQMNDMAQSIQSKVMQFGEKEFWMDWYHRYRRHSKEGDEKIATITGVKGVTFEKIDLGVMNTKFPPGVLVYSAKDAEYKDLVLRRDYMELLPVFTASLDPDGMRNFYKYEFMPLFVKDPVAIDNMFPKTVDEIKAEEENEVLAKNEMAPVSDTDNHQQHLIVHQMAKKTMATWVHMAWHEELLAQQKKMQQIQATTPMGEQQGVAKVGLGGAPGQSATMASAKQPAPGAQKKNPMQAAAPLQQETANTPQKQTNLSSNIK